MTIRSIIENLVLSLRRFFCAHNFINQKRLMGLTKNPNHRMTANVVFGPRMIGTFFMVSQCSKCGKIRRVEEPGGREEAYQAILKNPPQGGSGVRKPSQK